MRHLAAVALALAVAVGAAPVEAQVMPHVSGIQLKDRNGFGAPCNSAQSCFWQAAGVPYFTTGGVDTAITGALTLSPASPQNGFVSLLNNSYVGGNLTLKYGNLANSPSNGSVTASVTPTDPLGASTWYEGFIATAFPGGTRKDWVRAIGWNLDSNGTRVNNVDPAVGDQWESYYLQSPTASWVERHWIFINPDNTYYRPISSQMGYGSGNNHIINTIFTYDNINFNDRSGTNWFSMQTSYLLLNSSKLYETTNNLPWLQQANAAGSDNLYLMYLNASNRVQVGIGSGGGAGNAAGIDIGSGSSTVTFGGTLTGNLNPTTDGSGNLGGTSNRYAAIGTFNLTAGANTLALVGGSTTYNLDANGLDRGVAGALRLGITTATSIVAGVGSWQWTLDNTGVLAPTSNGNGGLGTSGRMPGQVMSFSYGTTIQTIAAASSVTITPSNGELVRVTLSGTAISTMTISAGIAGQRLVVEVIEDATGTRTIPSTWTNVLFAGGSYTRTATASKRDVLTFAYDSTDSKWVEMSRALSL